jgi:predicted Zn-dependent protease
MLTTFVATISLAFGASAPANQPLHNNLEELVEAAWSDETPDQGRMPQSAIDDDKEKGKKYSALVEKEVKLSKDTAMVERVQRLGGLVASIANKTSVTTTWGEKRLSVFDYTFKVVEDKDVNAFSLPGGYVYVNEGLIKYAESDDELVGVLAHEVAHAEMRHVATLQREQEKLSSIQLPLLLAAIFSGNSETIGAVLTGSSLVGMAKGSGWSVKAEQAADFGGFQYMLKTDYDPTGMLTFMERLARDDRSKPQGLLDLGIFRTHPPGRERADALIRYMTDSGMPIRRSHVATSFRATAKPVQGDQIEILYGGRHVTTLAGPDSAERAGRVTDRLNDFFDSMPELYDISFGPNGEILGRKQTLMTITTLESSALNKPARDLQQEAVRNLRTALYNVAYRVWDAR